MTVAVCVLASLAAGLLLGTVSGQRFLGPIGAAALFLLLIWDIRLALPLLIVVVPFSPKYTMSFGNLYLSTAVLIIVYLAYLLRVPATRDGFTFKYNSVVLAVLALLAVYGLSTLQSYRLLLSDRTQMLRYIQFVLFVGMFVLVWQMEFSPRAIRNLMILALACGIAQGFVGVLQWVSNPGFYALGTFGQHNFFGAYVTFVAFLLLGVVLETGRRIVVLCGIIALGVMVYSILISFSRTAYVFVFVSCLTFGLLPIPRWKRILVPSLSLATVAAGLVIAPLSIAERVRDIYLTATGEYIALSFKYRLGMWRAAYAQFVQSPVLGKGSGVGGLKDNFFVKATVEVGLLGLGVFVVLIYVVLRASYRAIGSRPADDFMRGIAVGFFPAAVGSLIIFNLSMDFLAAHRFMGTFWIVLALLLKYFFEAGQPGHQDD